MSRIPARPMPAYQADASVVRGKFSRRNTWKKKVAASASKPKRITNNTAVPLKIIRTSPFTKAAAVDCLAPANKFGEPNENENVVKSTKGIAAAQSLRSKARKRNRIKRNANAIKSEKTNPNDIEAMIVRAPRNCNCGPDRGCVGSSPSQAGTNHAALESRVKHAPKRQPTSTSRPTSGSRRPPASKRLQETSVAGQRRRT